MDKKQAIRIANQNGFSEINVNNSIFANVNRVWQLNPDNSKFTEDLYLLLSDTETNKLSVLKIPAGKIANPEMIFRQRKDKKSTSVIEIPVTTNNHFIDRISGFDFSPFFVPIIIDGLDCLLNLMGGNMESQAEYIISNSYFIYKKDVESINKKIRSMFDNKEKIPVRLSKKKGAFMKQNEIKQTQSKFTNATTANQETAKDFYYSSLRKDILIIVDKNGNAAVRNNINKMTGYFSPDNKNGILINYTLCHIWDKTNKKSIKRSSDPLYFSLLWNIVLVPSPFAFMTDKNEDKLFRLNPESKNKLFIKLIKNLIKAIAITLYDPKAFLAQFGYPDEINDDLSVNEEYSHESIMKLAKSMIDKGVVRFLPHI